MEILKNMRRCNLSYAPTPVEAMPRLTQELGGPKLLIKRDDQTGLALGGNKARKLEFLMAQAQEQQADTILTAGAIQSNHCRQTVAAAAKLGFACELILGGQPPEIPNGNLLLDMLLGARISWTGMNRRGEKMAERAAELRQIGRKPYVIPYGGSNAVGACGYVLAMQELVDHLQTSGQTVDYIVMASSSGGTQAGMVVGARAVGFHGKIIGVRIDKKDTEDQVSYEEDLAKLASETAKFVGMEGSFQRQDFHVNYDYLGTGYGVLGSRENEAIQLVAQLEGILLDPVYTGRAMGGLIAMIRKRIFPKESTVLFWHTGGAPALFAYAKELHQSSRPGSTSA